MQSVLDIFTHVIWALGGATVVIAGLSYWLGQIWAGRILEKERDARQRDLEQLRAELTGRLAQLEHELALQREKSLSLHELKLNLYKAAVDPIVPILTDISFQSLTPEKWPEYEKARLCAYSHLAMFAPSEVLDAYSALTEYILDCFDKKATYEWPHVRSLAIVVFNKIRQDVELSTDPVIYKGHR